MQNLFKWMLVIGSVLVLVGRHLTAAEPNQKDVVQMRVLLEEQGLDRFIIAIDEKGWIAPRIDSAWHVANITSEAGRHEEVEKRSFGKLLENRVSQLVKLLSETKEKEELGKHAESLLRLANWVEATQGYGNLFLAGRCRDVASIGIGKLIVDLDYPLEKGAGLVIMLTSPSVSTRAYVLNYESGASIFPTTSQQDLETVWQSGSILLREQKNPGLKAARLGNPPAGMEPVAATMQKAKVKINESPQITSNLRFFEDNVTMSSEPPTTANTWDKKWHQKLVEGFDLPNTALLQALTKFRATIGFFPTELVKHPFYTGGEGIFDRAWRSTKPEAANYKISALAWKAYDQIKHGKFLDEESRMLGRIRTR
jgi:hypothetical protein